MAQSNKKLSIKGFLQNMGLLLFVIIFFMMLMEFVVFPHVLLPNMPLKYHQHLPEGIRILAQSSKDALKPKDYIAIGGDSYAQGFGDWLMSIENTTSMDPSKGVKASFALHHVLHDILGRDVISFGVGGTASVRGLVCNPVCKYTYLNNTLLYKIDEPDTLIFLYYEGNDTLQDANLKKIYFDSGKYGFDPDRFFDPEYFKTFIEYKIANHRLLQKDSDKSIKDNLFFLDWEEKMYLFQVIERMVRYSPLGKRLLGVEKKYLKEGRSYAEMRDEELGKRDISGEDFADKVNIALVDRREMTIPAALQSPFMDSTEDTEKVALYVFEQSLKYISDYFKNTDIYIVYVPSVLECYDLVSEYVTISGEYSTLYKSEDISKKSDYFAGKIRDITKRNSVNFIDPRQFIRKHALKEFLHGPYDWLHFNQKGYELLGEYIAKYIKK